MLHGYKELPFFHALEEFVFSSRSCMAFNPLNQFMGSPRHAICEHSDRGIHYLAILSPIGPATKGRWICKKPGPVQYCSYMGTVNREAKADPW